MTESYDVGVLVHFPGAAAEPIGLELMELARKWDGQANSEWPFAVAILPVGDYLLFVFENPDNANMFVSHAEKFLQTTEDPQHPEALYSIVMCWTGLMGGEIH
ncbi:MAG: hypothetical protein ACYC0X_07415 [Pirellulaceae bacterium]